MTPLDEQSALRPHEALLSCESLTIRYGSRSRSRDSESTALNEVTLAVHPGEAVGLVGRNGAGKSTLIRAAAGLLAPAGGTVRVVGLDPLVQPAGVMRDTGFLLSDPALFAYLSAPEMLAVVADLHGLHGATADRRIAEMLALVELAEHGARRTSDYSTGMAKRLALACALLPEPRLLVLDEPFESLDPLIMRKLVQALRARRLAGAGILLSSHLLATVTGLCDRVVVIDGGRVLADDTVSAVIAAYAPSDDRTLDGAYAALVQQQ